MTTHHLAAALPEFSGPWHSDGQEPIGLCTKCRCYLYEGDGTSGLCDDCWYAACHCPECHAELPVGFEGAKRCGMCVALAAQDAAALDTHSENLAGGMREFALAAEADRENWVER